MKSIAICQPYFCPHIGYFKLINSVDLFVSYDDVNFIKGGWINRNKLLVSGLEKFFTIPLINQSSFSKINQVEVDWNNKNLNKFLKTVDLSYSKSPYKNDVIDILEKLLSKKPKYISELALESLKEFSKYLDISTEIKISSEGNYTKTDDRVKNIINICIAENASHYINPIGGTKLYDKVIFDSYGVKLNFIQSGKSLSIIDVCLTTPKNKIIDELNNYELV